MSNLSARFALTPSDEGGFVAFDPVTKTVSQGNSRSEATTNLLEAVELFLEGSEMTRTATCRCGQLSATCTGEPVRVSVCHCYDCQRRSGSAFAAKASSPLNAVKISGDATTYEHTNASGNTADFHFCRTCGSRLWFQARPHNDLISIPIGNFGDQDFPAPCFSVWEERKHPWVSIAGDDIEHHD